MVGFYSTGRNGCCTTIECVPTFKYYLIVKNEIMKKYVCTACHYVYDPEVGDPENGVAPGTAWDDVPEDWTCPLCGLGKDVFEEE